MTYFCDEESHPLPELISAGTFIGEAGWRHDRRVINSYEIICMTQGVLPIQIGDDRYMAGPGTFLLVPPLVEHQGFRPIGGGLKFDWFHFSLAGLHLADQPGSGDGVPDRPSILLPGYSGELVMDRIHVITNQLLDVYEMGGDQEYLNCILACILHEVTMQTRRTFREQPMDPHGLQPVHDWIRIHALGPISLEQIADYFNYNKSYLSRIYKKRFGINISREIERFRMEAAKSLLVETDDTVDEIGSIVGYNDAKYFMKTFKRNTGITPTRYRRTFNQRHFNSH